MLALLPFLLSTSATASEGPWTVGTGTASVYVGADAERITHLATSTGSYAPEVIEVDAGISKNTVKAIVSYGLMPGTEIQLAVPWSSNHLNSTDGALCAALAPTPARYSAQEGNAILEAGVFAIERRAKRVALAGRSRSSDL